ncbi:DUF5658 family protein [Neobacillus sp. C211]|jgi:hypothetical protein|uniref:DUF5658 family protein n=1 Tax=Bacillaceae TaxID=186817 RepID=UPI001BEC24EC|nr:MULTISPECIES: DUF5658 family protein [unclassified Bacillus (in: firmicutes)]MBT2726677.1 hypothetical protein [Bacillus sp. ISL-75]MBT2736926.1 hypothetical protein [Bacillus sp. ISL-7]
MRLCFFLLVAGLLDAVLTHFGIVSGIVEEGNPMMKLVIEKSWSYFYIIKIFLPLLLLGLFYLRPLKGWIRTLLVSTCVLYLSVLVYHMVWIVLYLNTAS